MSIILSALGGVTATAARQLMMNTDALTQEAASVETVNRLTTVPFETLQAAGGCDTVGTANMRFETCVAVTAIDNAAVVDITTSALQRGHVAPSTVRFTRVAPAAGSPLCLGC